MSLIRKVLWPSAIALGFLLFLATIGGSPAKTVSADEGEICEIVGPDVIMEGDTVLYVAFIDADAEHNYGAEIDNVSGRSFITSSVDDDGEYDIINPTTEVNDLEPIDLFDAVDEEDLIDDLLAVDPDFELQVNACGTATNTALSRLINDAIAEGEACAPADSNLDTGECDLERAGTETGEDDIDCPTAANCTIPAAVITAVVNSIAADLLNGELDCEDIALNAAKAAIGAGAAVLVAEQIEEFVEAACDDDFDVFDDAFLDAALIIDVTCEDAGEFTLSFFDMEEDDDAMSIDVVCQGAPDDATIVANPVTVEIIPAPGNVSHSLITVTLLADDEQAAPGSEVDFTVDKCSIETSGVDTAAEFTAARALFVAFNANVPTTSAAIESSAAATAAVDGSRAADATVSFEAVVGGSDVTVAAAILGCGPADAPGTTPGVATVTAIIEVEDGQDIVRQVRVTVIGPPAALTASASPQTLRCGEKSTINVTVKDSIGQNVSDHTRVEAVTNAGGVLGGTGAVANQAGLVSPISSTVAETFAGATQFFLLTSEQHSGPYEVVVTTGGSGALGAQLGGVFSTAPISVQTTVTCTIPTIAAPAGQPGPAAPQPTLTAPRTGTGTIVPPSTGEAGLADSKGQSALILVGAIAAFVVAGVAGIRFARR